MALGNTMSSRLQNFRKPWKWRCSSVSGSESLSCCACAYSVFVHYGMTWYFVAFVDIRSIERQERHGLGIVFRANLAVILYNLAIVLNGIPCDPFMAYHGSSGEGQPQRVIMQSANLSQQTQQNMEFLECQWSLKYFAIAVANHPLFNIYTDWLKETDAMFSACTSDFQRPEYKARAENFRKLHAYLTSFPALKAPQVLILRFLSRIPESILEKSNRRQRSQHIISIYLLADAPH